MTRDDVGELRKLLAAVYELYRKELSRTSLTLWAAALKGYELEVIRQALSVHVQNPDNGQFLPMPADIVKLIEGGSDDVALQAWAKVSRAVRSVGNYQSVVFDDAIIHYAIENMGGWISLGKKTEDEWPFLRNQFVTLYRGARTRAFEYQPRLIGIAEAHNAAANRAVALPVFIGDADKARAVLQRGNADSPAITSARPARELVPALENRT